MAKALSFLRRPYGHLLTALLLIALLGMANAYSTADPDRRPDIVTIDLPAVPGGEQMPAVPFLHDRHTRVLEGKDCSVCHLQEKGRLVFKFKRIVDSATETDMQVYHDNCVACHTETRAAGKPSGPLNGDCRSCHSTRSGPVSSWQPVRFDRSLHFTHASAKTIRPLDKTDDANCSACHHQYDENTKKTVYRKGEEDNCRYCHTQSGTPEVSSIRWASHDTCLNCHKTLIATSQTAGPIDCEGCHGPDSRKALKQHETLPRLMRNQPDAAILSPTAEIAKDKPRGMPAIAFNHKGHEAAVADCKSCHHAAMSRCGECHTPGGDKKGALVTAEQAMHASGSDQSCIGCHQQVVQRADCAGCHADRTTTGPVSGTCDRCHQVDLAEVKTISADPTARQAMASRKAATRKDNYRRITDEEIPDKVTIDVMVDQYEAAVFPHRQVVRKLMEKVSASDLASVFHQSDLTLCAGCHHNSPVSTRPPACAACHKQSDQPAEDGRPGLKAAFHNQCNSCHKQMKIAEPAAEDCTKCHKPRNPAS